MKKIISLLPIALLSCCFLWAQPTLLHNDRAELRNGPTTFNPDWAPFYHGVASGDPLADRLIIWTRVTPEAMNDEPIAVDWQLATDLSFENVVQNGTFTTDASRDYTVKVDVTGLQAGTTYYYLFTALNKNSLIGKTKTTPTGAQASHLKFGVVSCSNFQAGYFNGYKRLSERNDLDAVLHLGDYIYEYPNGQYGDSALFAERPLDPDTEILSLEDYRARYSTYRLDTALARVHQQHAFITVWDDHESANDAYKDGAQNHNPETEGDWETRKAIAKQVYFEWMPIRETDNLEVYRSIRYGDILDLIMLDTRLEGREKQIRDVAAPELQDPGRTLLGAEQKAWLLEQLSNSTAKWKVIGQQVIFSELNVGWAALVDDAFTYDALESTFLDIWDGYPAERAALISYIDENEIDNVVILTGDFHSTFAFDVAANPVDLQFQEVPGFGSVPNYLPSDTYDPATGEGAIAVEFATPSITSANFDENLDLATGQTFQQQINTPIAPFPGFNLGNPNPHMKLAELIQHGYFILDIQSGQAQADWYFSDISMITEEEAFHEGWYTTDGDNHLQQATAPSAPKAMQDTPAPNDPPQLANAVDAPDSYRKFALLALYPNPFKQQNTLHYSLAERARVQIGLFDAKGQLVRQLLDETLQPGVFSLQASADGLAEGTYFYRITVGGEVYTAKVMVQR